ncbi:MAG TPA: Ku protein [Bryobacteraceae bacterium]|nr:Ku protein [Bryobacteraceae bacterium]
MPAVVWKGFVSFGLVSFPVRLQAAARETPVRFHMLHKKDMSRVKEVFYCRAEDKPLDKGDIVKGYEVSKDEYVVIDQAELDKIAPKTAKVMDILQFVKADEFDPVFMDKSYHVLPEGDVLKPYALLREAMVKRQQFAIAKLAMHNREHIVVLRPSGEELMLHTMFFADEVQKATVKAVSAKFSDKEMKLAFQLIDTLSGRFQPEKYHDEYQANVERLVEQKQKGERIRPTAYRQPRAPVSILEALQKSLAENKAEDKAGSKPAPKRKSRSRKAA